jgi:spectinomycin phosphotransferase
MIEKPKINEDKIVNHLRTAYGIFPGNLKFLPLGNSTNAWMYEVVDDGGRKYFLKLKKGELFKPSLSIPQYLKNNNVDQIVAPIPDKNDCLFSIVAGFTLILYPFITTDTASVVEMSHEQWVSLGKIVKEIHSTNLSGLVAELPKENFSKKWIDWIKDLSIKIEDNNNEDVLKTQMARIWNEKLKKIDEMVERAVELSQAIEKRNLENVLCHTDLHEDNILVKDKEIFIVDWDNPMLAPKERDLMFMIGTKNEGSFFIGYGKTTIDKQVMAYYLYEWVIQDMCDYLARVFTEQDSGSSIKKAAMKSFCQLFEPGNAVDKADQYYSKSLVKT